MTLSPDSLVVKGVMLIFALHRTEFTRHLIAQVFSLRKERKRVEA